MDRSVGSLNGKRTVSENLPPAKAGPSLGSGGQFFILVNPDTTASPKHDRGMGWIR